MNEPRYINAPQFPYLPAVVSNPFDERFPTEPPINSVLKFERTLNGMTYVYTAFRAPNDVWYISGRGNQHDRSSWLDVRAGIADDARCEIATAWFEIPRIVDESRTMSPADYVAANYGRGLSDKAAAKVREHYVEPHSVIADDRSHAAGEPL